MSSSSRQRSIIRHPHDYTGATVETRVEGSGPNRQSITVEYAYATNSNNRNTIRASQYASSRGTTPRAGSPVDRPAVQQSQQPRIRHSLSKPPPSKPRRPERGDSVLQQQQVLEAPQSYDDHEDAHVQQHQPQDMNLYSPPPRPSRANTESLLQDMYTPEVAAFSDDPPTPPPQHQQPQQQYFDHNRRDSLPDLPPDIGGSAPLADDNHGFETDMSEALPAIDPYSPPPTSGTPGGSGSRSRSATASKPKKSGMLSFMSGKSRIGTQPHLSS